MNKKRIFTLCIAVSYCLFLQAFAEGFRIDTQRLSSGEERHAAILRNRPAWAGGRSIIRIECTPPNIRHQTRIPYRFIIRHNGEAFRNIISVTLQVDDGSREEFNNFISLINTEERDISAHLRLQGNTSLVLREFSLVSLDSSKLQDKVGEWGLTFPGGTPIFNSINFTQIEVGISGSGNSASAIERIIEQMRTGEKLYVSIVKANNQTHNTDYKLANSLNSALERLSRSCP